MYLCVVLAYVIILSFGCLGFTRNNLCANVGVNRGLPRWLMATMRSVSLDLAQVFTVDKFLGIYTENDVIKGVYAVEGRDEKVKFVGVADDIRTTLTKHLQRHGSDEVSSVRVQTFSSQSSDEFVMTAYRNELIKQTKPLGNLNENDWDKLLLEEPHTVGVVKSPFSSVSQSEGNSIQSDKDIQHLNIRPDVTSILELTKANVDKVLDEVRPYLIADGGNVAVVSIDDKTRSISLILQGACGSCASSTTTMKMGIERVLNENFSNLGPIISVDPQSTELLTIKMVEDSLSKILPAIKGMGGAVDVKSTEHASGTVTLGYKGPARLRQGIELVLKDIPLIKIVIVEEME